MGNISYSGSDMTMYVKPLVKEKSENETGNISSSGGLSLSIGIYRCD
jgi:hypothetical protein